MCRPRGGGGAASSRPGPPASRCVLLGAPHPVPNPNRRAQTDRRPPGRAARSLAVGSVQMVPDGKDVEFLAPARESMQDCKQRYKIL